jgi:hypothetical protein
MQGTSSLDSTGGLVNHFMCDLILGPGCRNACLSYRLASNRLHKSPFLLSPWGSPGSVQTRMCRMFRYRGALYDGHRSRTSSAVGLHVPWAAHTP